QTLLPLSGCLAHRLTLLPRRCIAWQRPIREIRRVNRAVVLVQIYPNRVEVIEVSSETEACTSALEGLRLRACRRVLVVGPLLANAGMRSKTVNGYLGNDHDLRGNSGSILVPRRTTLEVLRYLNVITAGP